MSKIAFIFPGQGAQVCGMGQDFYEQTETGRKVFDTASEILGFSMPELCFEKNDRLDITEYTQPAMVTASLAMMKVLMEQTGIKPDAAAGLSLGEYPAMAAAGVMSEEDAIRTVRERGILMQEAVPAGIGAMAAVLAMDAEEIENPGEAVLTSTGTANLDYAARMKLNREQIRSKNKEALLEIVNNTSVADNLKQDAVNKMVAMTDIAEREAAAEMLLEAKGFSDVVVSITDDNCDVVLNMGEVTDAKRAQVEDIVKRKTNISADKIVITPIVVTDAE